MRLRERPVATAFLLLAIFATAAGLRLTGVDWDQDTHLHPDERFLFMVTSSLEPVHSLHEYLDSAHSTLNPANTGYRPEYVYGTFPVILVRALVPHTDAGIARLQIVGRRLSALCDLAVVLLTFCIAVRLFGRRVGILAATFSALAVLQIQQSHFFTVDTVANLFVVVSLYCALRVADPPGPGPWRLLWPSLLGVAAATAAAAKLSAAPAMALLPAALALRATAEPGERKARALLPPLVVGGLLALVTFRLLQPYAFTGPGLFDVGLEPRWLKAIRNLAALSGADADWPPALQWARRSPLFALKNLVQWGLGPALGLLALTGFAAFARRALRGSREVGLLLWTWTGAWVAWQSLTSNPTMRYLLPVYAPLAIFAGWALVALWDRGRRRLAAVVGAAALLTTAAWAFAFASIYTRPATRVAASRFLYAEAPAAITLQVAGGRPLLVPFPADTVVTPLEPYTYRVVAGASSSVTAVRLPHVVIVASSTADSPGARLTVTLSREAQPGRASRLTAELGREAGVRALDLPLAPPLVVHAGETLTVEVTASDAAVRLEGAGLANESEWDDALPLRLDGHDPFGGLYPRDLRLELYQPDDVRKRERMLSVLDRADDLLISSSRQWGSISRLPERYPLVTAYYRHLLGCPDRLSVSRCYERAEPGRSSGRLGFELVEVFTSYPRLGPLEVNDQSAEEAFTVYDHPKVFVFRKTAGYDPQRVRALLEAVDLTRVVPVAPGRAGCNPADLMLPADRLSAQRAGGTWSELFDRQSWLNRWPPLTALAWYLTLTALGLCAYPLLRLAFFALPDRGYAVSRVVGLLLLAYPVWLLGSFGVPVERATIFAVAALLAAAGLTAAWRQREQLRQEWQSERRRFLTVECLFLALFVAGLLVRIGNPDLWHLYRGGEKPMDFAYLNAVLKSSSFPPYDPWFAGGYINYYYWGLVLVGVPVKWLGIVPAVAYNLVLPTLFALVGCGACSVGWNVQASTEEDRRRLAPGVVGVGAALAVGVLGNLGSAAMLIQGLYRLGGGAAGSLVSRAGALLTGLGRLASGQPLPFGLDEWYWNPTRIIPDPDVVPITEFPYFTFLYGDLHAHLLDMPLILLVLTWALAAVLAGRVAGRIATTSVMAAVALGSIATGALSATNTWSFYPFLALAAAALAYAVWQRLAALPPFARLAASGAAAFAFAALCRLAFLPFSHWYGQAYGQLEPWRGAHTPLGVYLLHWGALLTPVAAWIAFEARSWLLEIRPVRPTWLNLTPLLVAAGVLAGLLAIGVQVAWVAWPLVVAATLLLGRPGLTNSRRLVLVAATAGLFLTLAVEVVVLRGDIGRMNTVFKLYLQAWLLLGVSAAAATGWLAGSWSGPGWLRRPLRATLALLVGAAALYPLLATPARIRDRMAPAAPRGLDGMAFMRFAHYVDEGKLLELAEDWAAIRWLCEHAPGSPVVVEAATPEYRWGARISIYTGLPSVVGWSWHQRQQRALTPQEWVTSRFDEIREFYTTEDPAAATAFLRRYAARYVVVGQLERAYYPGPGLAKFPLLDGRLWRKVFEQGETAVYEVLPQPAASADP